MDYDPDVNYCGPKGKTVSKLIPRDILGIDTSYCCWSHDRGYELQQPKREVDWQYWLDMKGTICAQTYWASPRRHLALAIAYRRYLAVRLFGGRAYKRAGTDRTAEAPNE